MSDNAIVFWKNVKKEIKLQNTTHEWVARNSGISFNTFQGWIAKNVFPRVNEAIRIAASLNTSVEYLAGGSVNDSKKSVAVICHHLPKVQEHLDLIYSAVKNLQ